MNPVFIAQNSLVNGYLTVVSLTRGAGNTNLKTGPESDASRKRRALSACRDKTVRDKTGLVSNEKECTARVLAGEIDFLLEAL